ncbi:MAG: glycosyltransferase family 39 protein [Candidatus Omnitrophica bacterium]|nr:glycosyltransferase family 39 protein [Candidatus Omnitrophota bacterium]
MRTLILLFVFIFSVLFLFSNGRFGGDGLEDYLTAESLVLDQDLAIHDRPFAVKEMRYQPRGEAGQKGYYSPHGIGMPMLLVPFYLIGLLFSGIFSQLPRDYLTQFFCSLANPFFISMTAVALFKFVEDSGLTRKTSFYTTLVYCFSTMTLIYGRSGFSEPALAFFILLAFYYLFLYEKQGKGRHLVFFSCCVGSSILIKDVSFLYLPLFFLYVFTKCVRVRSKQAGLYRIKLLSQALIPLATFVFFYFFVHALAASNVSASPTGRLDLLVKYGFVLGLQPWKGLYYFLLSPGKGFFVYNPVLLCGLFGVAYGVKRLKIVSWGMLGFMLFTLLYYGSKFTRGSLFSWGPRYLYTVIPLFSIFLAFFMENIRTMGKRLIVFGFSVIGFFIQLPALVIGSTQFIFFVKEKLGLSEYLINFMPELSPIKGSWALLSSAITNSLTGRSLTFVYKPDVWFIQPVEQSMVGYDSWDIWWVHAVALNASLKPLVWVACGGLAVIAMACVAQLMLHGNTRAPAQR